MSVKGITLGIVFAGLFGCAQVPDLQDSFRTSDFRLPYDQRLLIEAGAPVIVVGRVVESRAIGRPRNSPGDSRVRTQLTRLKISIEEVVKGAVRTNTLEFYYFTYSLDNTVDLGVPWYIPRVGQRRVYFLRLEGGVYRSVGDVTNYTLEVSSGIHSLGFCRGKAPGCCIAEMLLTPGRDMDVNMFVEGLYKAGYAAKQFCSATNARELMERLARNPDKRIADRAREVIQMLPSAAS
jgi:hypothetical protein